MDDLGTWKKLTETSYEEKLTDTTWSPDGGSPADKAKISARFAQNKSRILADANKQPVKTIKWQGNDEFTESSGTQSVTYHRVP